jgi:ATP-dependent Clp protease ATP-binding subunit ClpA
MYKDRFTKSGQSIFDKALRESRSRNQNYISVSHILYAVANLKIDLFATIINTLGIDYQEVNRLIEKQIEQAPLYTGEGIRLAPEVNDLFKRSLERARVNGREKIQATDLIGALSQDENGLLIDVLKTFYDGSENIIETIHSLAKEFEQSEKQNAPDMSETEVKQGNISLYKAGETIRVKSGAFTGFTGKVREVNQEKSTLIIKVLIFKRPKYIELNFSDVDRVVFT